MEAAFLRSTLTAVAIATAIVAPTPAAAIENSHALGGQIVPLPVGEWELLAAREDELTLAIPARTARMTSMAAALQRDGQVVAVVVARANLAPVRSGFGLTETCRRADLHFHRNDTPRGSLTAACQFVGHAIQDVGPGSAPIWTEAVAAMRAKGWTLPVTWLMAGYRLADDQDLLDVRYLFNPETFGLTDDGAIAAMQGRAVPQPGWADRAWSAVATAAGYPPPPHDPRWLASSWAIGQIEPQGPRELLVRHLVHWAEASQPAVQLGFKNRSNGPLPMPRAWTGKRGAVREGVETPASDGDLQTSSERALWKTLSWRSLGSGLDALVAYAMTGSAGVAGAITVVGGAVNATAYFLHELAWDAVGSSGGPGDRVTELPAVAVIR